MKTLFDKEQNRTVMKPVTVKFSWLYPEKAEDLPLPTYHSRHASGMDVAAAVAGPVNWLLVK